MATFMHHAKMPAGHLVTYILLAFPYNINGIATTMINIIIPRDAPGGHRRGNNPVEYVVSSIFIFLPRSRKKQWLILIEV